MSLIIPPERRTLHILDTRHLVWGKHTDTNTNTHINVHGGRCTQPHGHVHSKTHAHIHTHAHTHTHTHAHTHTHMYAPHPCTCAHPRAHKFKAGNVMNCLLCGVMFDNQVCNLLRSYRGPLRCIRLIYGQLYLTIIAILQNMCTGIPSDTCLYTTSSLLVLILQNTFYPFQLFHILLIGESCPPLNLIVWLEFRGV